MLYLLVLPWTEDAADYSLRQEDCEFELNLRFIVSVAIFLIPSTTVIFCDMSSKENYTKKLLKVFLIGKMA